MKKTHFTLSKHEKQIFGRLLLNYLDVFALYQTGTTHPVRHTKLKPEAIQLVQQTEVENLLQAVANLGVIEPSIRPLSLPVVLVTKKERTTILRGLQKTSFQVPCDLLRLK